MSKDTTVIGRIWKRIQRSVAFAPAAFRVRPDRVVDNAESSSSFVSRASYFEIRISEQFLQNRREYWNNYNPLVVTLCDFIYDTERSTVPFVVGPELLSSIEQIDVGDRVRYLNTRVVGPIPYMGDDLAVFIGLFRTRTSPWAQHALGLIESVAAAFDPTKLSSGYLDIAGSILNGVEAMLGIGKDVDFRVGKRVAYTTPGTATGNPLQPGYFVMLHANENEVDSRRFWVQDNRLFVGTSADRLSPYLDHDFVLWQLRALDNRDDFVTFDFHREWRKVQDRIWRGEASEDSFRVVLHLLAINRDLIQSHRNRLMLEYRKLYQNELETYGRDFTGPSLFSSNTSVEGLVGALGRFRRFRVDDDMIKAIPQLHGRVWSELPTELSRSCPRLVTNEELADAVAGQEFADEVLDKKDSMELSTVLNLELSNRRIY